MQQENQTEKTEEIIEEETYVLSNGTVFTGELAEGLTYLAHAHIENSDAYMQDEIGMAQLFATLYGQDWFRCEETGVWYNWDGKNWTECLGDDAIRRRISDMYALIKIYILDSTERGKNLGSFPAFIRRMCTAGKLRAVAEILGLNLSRSASELDSAPYIINTPHRAYDLKMQKTVSDALKKEMLLTRATAVSPAGKALTCPEWDSFIDEIMSGDEEKKSFLQRALGYSLLGDNREECMFIAYGPKTRNGKGTLFSAVMNAVGRDYACTAPAEPYMRRQKTRGCERAKPHPCRLSGQKTSLDE